MKLSVYVDGSGKDYKIKELADVKAILKKYMESKKKDKCSFEIIGLAELRGTKELYSLFG